MRLIHGTEKTAAILAAALAFVFIIGPGASKSVGQTETVLHNFVGGSADGQYPQQSGLLFLGGNYYGVTDFGGTNNDGVVYQLTPGSNGTWNETVIHSFTGGSDGSVPLGTLIADAAGNIYGTTVNGGAQNAGTAFELSKSSGQWKITILHSFGAGFDGASPYGPLVFDQSGNLYGTTVVGGGRGYGTVFEISPAGNGTWTENVLYSFGSGTADGTIPAGGLVVDSAGNLYGVTTNGGLNPCGGLGCGIAFQLTHASGTWTENIIYHFHGTDGLLPNGPLTMDGMGNLYGTTQYGGHLGRCQAGIDVRTCGVAYKLSLTGSTWTQTILHEFAGGNFGSEPNSKLVFDTAGNLYGETAQVQNDNGTVYRLSPSGSTWRFAIVHHFNGSDGANPQGGVLVKPGHILLGTTIYGGSGNSGVAFEIKP